MIKGQSEKKHWQWQPLLAIICCYDCGSVTQKTNAKASQFSEPEYYLQGGFAFCSRCSPHILSTLMLLSPEANVKSGHSCPLCLKGERKKLAEPRNQTQKSKVWNRFESRASSSSRQSEHISHFLFKTPLE